MDDSSPATVAPPTARASARAGDSQGVPRLRARANTRLVAKWLRSLERTSGPAPRSTPR